MAFVYTQMAYDVFHVGVIDWAIRVFHGYNTDEGSSYNSYLIMDEHPTLIDCVKYPFAAEHRERIANVCPLDKIEYVVMNHAEGDHSSSLPILIPYLPNAKIVTNNVCKMNMQTLYPALKSFDRWMVVDAKTTLNIGKRTLNFVPIPLVHWPDSMVTFSPYDNILYSNDAFGQHIASSERWADQLDVTHAMKGAKEYIANILGHVPHLIKKTLEAVQPLDIKIILPAHGVAWRGDTLGHILGEYASFANQTQFAQKVSIIYDSMYGSTARVALSIGEGVKQAGCGFELLDLKACNLTKTAAAAYQAPVLAFGSPTLNATCMPALAATIHYLGGLYLLKGKDVFVFGAYGWLEKATKELSEMVTKFGAKLVGEPLIWKFYVDDGVLSKGLEVGAVLGKKALERAPAK